MECGRGKGLGGSSLINGMCYIRGNAMDFDNWAKAPGLEDWSYPDCLPYFRKAETRDIGPNDFHGGDGPVSVATPKKGNNPLFHAMIEAGVQAGYPRTDDLNGYQQEGFGPMDRTVTPKGRRASTARGYLDQAKPRPNLTIVTHALTDRILFEGKRATGVSYFHGDDYNAKTANAKREVLLCSGAIASPQILQRSGVGAAELLNRLEIPLVHDLPGVGENLQDHLEMYLQYSCTQPVSLYPALQMHNQPAIGAEWLFKGTGVGASNQFEAGGFIRSREEFAWPNIQYHFLPVAINYNGSNAVKEHGFQAHVGSMRSPSRGRVQVKSKDPRQHPSILFNYMATEQDWQEFRDAIRITREIMNQPALDAYRGREISPGANVQTDEELDAFIREHAETAFHPSCTCKMGTDELAVVDGEGRVHGIENLRVVDASIMPQIITGNLNATTIMIAEKIADKIRGRQPLPRSTAEYYTAGDAPVRKPPLKKSA
jgi:choline dehydrogenase